MTENKEPEYDFSAVTEVDPSPVIRQMDNILSVELVKNGEEPDLVFFTTRGKRYLVDVRVYDVTAVPFYKKFGFKERLTAFRKAHPFVPRKHAVMHERQTKPKAR